MSKYGLSAPDPEAIRIDGVSYVHNRFMAYHPEFHPNQGKPFSLDDLEYLCSFYDYDDLRTLAFALGRTERSCRSRYERIKAAGLLDYYRQSYKRKLEAN